MAATHTNDIPATLALVHMQHMQKDLQAAIDALPTDEAHWEQRFRLKLMLKNVDGAMADVKRALEH